MRLSVSLTSYSWREVPLVDGLVRAAVTADQRGLDTVWVPDHLAQVDPTVPAEAADMLTPMTEGAPAMSLVRVPRSPPHSSS